MKFACSWLTIQAACCSGRKIADGLNGVDYKEQADGYAGGWFKCNAKVHDLRQLKDSGFRNVCKAYHSEETGEDIACDHTDQYGGKL